MVWIVGFLTVYVLALFAIAWICLHPFRLPVYISPGSFGAPQEDVEFESDGNLLKGWWLDAPDSNAVVIFAHGYMMNRCELTPEAIYLWKRGLSTMVFDHRAHGKSGGTMSGLGLKERVDIAAAVREAKRRKPGAKVALVGSSMGSAAAVLALADDPSLLDLAVIDSSYSKLSSASVGWWRFLGGNALMVILAPTTLVAAPMAGVNPFKVDIGEALGKFDGPPLLFMHGSRDRLALPSEAQRNFDAYNGPKKLIWFEGSNHSEGRWEQPVKYHEELEEFLKENGFLPAPPQGHAASPEGVERYAR